MDRIQRLWFESLTSALSLPRDSFRLFQPAMTISSASALASLENLAAPEGLSFSPDLQSPRSFVDQYRAALERLLPPSPAVWPADELGEEVWQEWQTYLQSIAPPPPAHDLPQLFR